MADLILFGTEACHLCEEAEQLLRNAGLGFAKKDIASGNELLQRYGIRIPVLLHRASGLELDWPFDALNLEGFLSKAAQRCLG